MTTPLFDHIHLYIYTNKKYTLYKIHSNNNSNNNNNSNTSKYIFFRYICISHGWGRCVWGWIVLKKEKKQNMMLASTKCIYIYIYSQKYCFVLAASCSFFLTFNICTKERLSRCSESLRKASSDVHFIVKTKRCGW
jgi:hypothetical protein